MFKFQLLKQSKKSKARLGILKTSHGEVETPAFVPVATQAVIKTLNYQDVLKTKSQLLICNTYHLHLRPGEDVVKKSGGLHKFTKWPKPIMTDSGGFQVFSLGFGKDFGMGKILKKHNYDHDNNKLQIRANDNPKNLRITLDGVYFKSHLDGRELFLGPRESIKIQEKLGADIILAFDECTSPIADHEYTKKSLFNTHRWAKICLDTKSSTHSTSSGQGQALYGITQGGKFKDLRIESARFIGALPFDGFAIGGEFGDDKKKMQKMIEWTIDELPEDKPRHLLGIGYPEDIPIMMRSGIDTFDCNVPTHYARRGIAFIGSPKNVFSAQRINVSKAQFIKDLRPLDPKCNCFVCQSHTRSYISHLFRANEITGMSLVTFHNLYFYNTLVEKLRNEIKNGGV